MKFYAGQVFEHGGLKYRVIAGKNCDGDLIIEFSIDGRQWHRPEIAHSLICVQFKYDVEENNYGKSGKIVAGKGGGKLMESIRRAVKLGWEVEARAIELEKKWKNSSVRDLFNNIESTDSIASEKFS